MQEDKAPAWRTVLTVLALGGYMLAGAWILRGGGHEMFGPLVFGLTSLGGVQGAKAIFEHRARQAKKAP